MKKRGKPVRPALLLMAGIIAAGLAGAFGSLRASADAPDPATAGTLIPIQPQVWTNAKQATATQSETGGPIAVKMDTNGLESGYYTLQVYAAPTTGWQQFGAIDYKIKNNKDSPLYVSFSAQDAANQTLSVQQGMRCLLRATGSDEWEIITDPQGSFTVPASFEGDVLFFLNTVTGGSSGGTNAMNASLQSWGLSVVAQQNSSVDASIASVYGISKTLADTMDENSQFWITGDDQLQIPYIGESIYSYTLQSASGTQGLQITLEKAVDGVTIDADGQITLKPGAQDGSLTLVAKNSRGYYSTKQISLAKSAYSNYYASDGTPMFFPSPVSVKKVVPSGSLLYDDRFYVALRIAGAGVILLAAAFYLAGRYRLKHPKTVKTPRQAKRTKHAKQGQLASRT